MNERRLFTFALLVSLALVSGSLVAQGSAVPPPIRGVAEARGVDEVSRPGERSSDAIVLPGGIFPDWWTSVQQDIRPSKYQVTWQDQPFDVLGNVAIMSGRQVLALNDYTVSSPDGSIVVTVSHDTDSGEISYRATKDSATVIESSSLGVQTDIGDFSNALAYVGQSSDTISETYAIPHGKKSTYVNRSNVLTLTFSKDSVAMDLVVRAYDDGIGYRYHIPGDGEIEIYSESSAIDLPDLEGGWGKEYSDNYEEMEGSYSYNQMQDKEWAMPVLFELDSGYWVLVSEATVYGHYAGARIQCEAEGRLSIELDDAHDRNNPIVTSRPFYSPWRVAFITANLVPDH
jgi:alpha-glucosidase